MEKKKETKSVKAKMPAQKTRKNKKERQITVSIWIFVCVLAAVLILTIIPYITDRSSPEKGARLPHGGFGYGIDISRYQHDIEWDSLMVLTDGAGRTILSKTHAKDIRPVSFIFIKATEGTSMTDIRFRKHWENAGRKGVRRGAYHFFRSSKDPVQQAEHFIKTVGPLRTNDLPPVLDIETIHAGCPVQKLNENALAWLQKVEEHYGRKPVVYSSSSFIKDILNEEIKENYIIWVAHYGCSSPDCSRWHFWQFTDKGLVYGIKGFVDMNACRHSMLKKL